MEKEHAKRITDLIQQEIDKACNRAFVAIEFEERKQQVIRDARAELKQAKKDGKVISYRLKETREGYSLDYRLPSPIKMIHFTGKLMNIE